MRTELKKKYGLITAIAMVVGTVIGSGVFFKASKVLTNNNGNMTMSLLTVAVVGLIMMICSYVFAQLAQRYEKVNGIVDYAEATCGKNFAYGVGWFLTT
ncbi:MAG: amino acid permease, partial [Clostridia bacterium]|nr:amino acid permease [Clostridia bacterium]